MGNNTAWLTVEEVVNIHDDQIARYGGLPGLKSIALLESAVASPLNHHHYGEQIWEYETLSFAYFNKSLRGRGLMWPDGSYRQKLARWFFHHSWLYLS